ncbi:hypothetical protein [Clostridium botulinum]
MTKKIYSTFQIKAIVYSFSNKEIIFWLILNSHFFTNAILWQCNQEEYN